MLPSLANLRLDGNGPRAPRVADTAPPYRLVLRPGNAVPPTNEEEVLPDELLAMPTFDSDAAANADFANLVNELSTELLRSFDGKTLLRDESLTPVRADEVFYDTSGRVLMNASGRAPITTRGQMRGEAQEWNRGSKLVSDWRKALEKSMVHKIALYEAQIEALRADVIEETQLQNRLVKAARKAIKDPTQVSMDTDDASSSSSRGGRPSTPAGSVGGGRGAAAASRRPYGVASPGFYDAAVPEEFVEAGLIAPPPAVAVKESNALAQPDTHKWDIAKTEDWYIKQARIEYVQNIVNAARRRHALLYDTAEWVKTVRRFLSKLKELQQYENVGALLEKMSDTIRGFIANPLVGSNSMINFAIFGDAGTGKTRLANTMGSVLGILGLYVYEDLFEIRPTDLTAGFEGQTQAKATSKLDEGLERPMFIDEAHNLIRWDKDPVTGERQIGGYSGEVLGVLIQWTQKYVGQYAMIFAGYEDKMNENFFPSDQGWERRIPTRVRMGEMGPKQLFGVMVEAIARAIVGKPPVDKDELPEFNRQLDLQVRNVYTWFTRGAYALFVDVIEASRKSGTFGTKPDDEEPPYADSELPGPQEPFTPPPYPDDSGTGADDDPKRTRIQERSPGPSAERVGGKRRSGGMQSGDDGVPDWDPCPPDDHKPSWEDLWLMKHGPYLPRDDYVFPLLYELFSSGAGSAVTIASQVAFKLAADKRFRKGTGMPKPPTEAPAGKRKMMVKSRSSARRVGEAPPPPTAAKPGKDDAVAVGVYDMYVILLDAIRNKFAARLVVHENGLLRAPPRGGGDKMSHNGYDLAENELKRALTWYRWCEWGGEGDPFTYKFNRSPPIGDRTVPTTPVGTGGADPRVLLDKDFDDPAKQMLMRDVLKNLDSAEGLVVGTETMPPGGLDPDDSSGEEDEVGEVIRPGYTFGDRPRPLDRSEQANAARARVAGFVPTRPRARAPAAAPAAAESDDDPMTGGGSQASQDSVVRRSARNPGAPR